MAEVKIIETKEELPKTIRIAAYARVSSDKDAMLHSLSSQISYFSEFIQKNDKWTYVGVYSDEAKTGTKDSRAGFQRMVQDAKEGKFDVLLVKSISRLARNTLTLLETVRMFKELGIDIYFDEQKIHTLSSSGELLLSILASYAQEESRACSENTLWRVRKNFEEGKLYGGDDCWGYKIIDRKLTVVPEEAELVKRIYRLYLQGCGDIKICRILNNEGIKAYKGGLWTKGTVRNILTNQNYTGDLVLQKTYKENHITKRSKINHGERQMYINEDEHELIIDKATFLMAQEERKRRIKHKGSESQHHPFAGLLICGNCGKRYKFKKSKYHSKYECITYNDLGKDYCASKSVPEETLIKIANELMNTSSFDEGKFRLLVNYIIVNDGNLLVIHFTDGTTKNIYWKNRSRSESWTPEMKEQARRRNYERGEKHGC